MNINSQGYKIPLPIMTEQSGMVTETGGLISKSLKGVNNALQQPTSVAIQQGDQAQNIFKRVKTDHPSISIPGAPAKCPAEEGEAITVDSLLALDLPIIEQVISNLNYKDYNNIRTTCRLFKEHFKPISIIFEKSDAAPAGERLRPIEKKRFDDYFVQAFLEYITDKNGPEGKESSAAKSMLLSLKIYKDSRNDDLMMTFSFADYDTDEQHKMMRMMFNMLGTEIDDEEPQPSRVCTLYFDHKNSSARFHINRVTMKEQFDMLFYYANKAFNQSSGSTRLLIPFMMAEIKRVWSETKVEGKTSEYVTQAAEGYPWLCYVGDKLVQHLLTAKPQPT